MKSKVLIVDDHPFTRAGVRALLEKNEDIEIVGEARDGLEAISVTKEYLPDIVVMDISMPNLSGIEATKEILKAHPEVRVIALSIHTGEQYVKEMLDAGAEGYLVKDEAAEELLSAISAVLEGNMYLSSSVTMAALKGKVAKPARPQFNILKTKILRPPVWEEYIQRDRITIVLEGNLVKPLSLISAGAGYGKSVAASQWLDKTQRLHTWISLDEEHNDFRIFLCYLVAAIDQVMPGSMRETEKAIAGTELPVWKDLLFIIFNDLFDIEDDIILVLDDYHKITEQKIHDFFNEWLRFPPPNIHLSIITRRDPALNLNVYRLSDRMTEIRMDMLSFTNEEIAHLFKKKLAINLNEPEIRVLQDKTEGWIIALRLAAMVMRNPKQAEKILETFEGGLNNMSEYLISEVLANLPEKIKYPLLASSINNRFCDDLLDNILEEESAFSGAELINYLEKANLFLIDLDMEKRWFRYHHLFQELLQRQLNLQYSNEKIAQYHLKASRWFEQHGFLDEAMDHALAADDLGTAAEILRNHRLDLLNNNNYYQLEHLQRKLPMPLVESDPWLILIELYIQWTHGNFVRLGELEETLNKILDQVEEDSEIRAEFHFFVGFNTLFLKGDLASALDHFDVAMKVVPESSSEPRGLLELHYMIFGQLGGLYEKVRKMYYELITQDLAPIRKNRIYQGFFAASHDQADLGEVDSNYLESISFARKSGMKDALGIQLYFAGALMFRRGSWKEAMAYFNEVLDIRYFVHSRVVIDSLTGLIISNTLLDKKSEAEEVMDVLENYTIGLGDFFKSFMWSCRTRYYMLTNNRKAVVNQLKVYKPGVLDLVLWLDIPEITHARALVYEGSDANLKQAEEELAQLEGVTSALQNKVHLLEVKILQALLFDQSGDLTKAKEALVSSLSIAEPENMVLYYVELEVAFVQLLNRMPDNMKSSPFINKVIEEINSRKSKDFQNKPATKQKKLVNLTQSEMKILEHVAEGLRNKEIADKLFVSEDTVKKHMNNMFKKMNVRNRLSLVANAKEGGILVDS